SGQCVSRTRRTREWDGEARRGRRSLSRGEWAKSLGNQGVALMLVAERRRDAAMAKTALSQINTAFETMRDDGNAPSAAYYEQQLPRARAIVARLRGR